MRRHTGNRLDVHGAAPWLLIAAVLAGTLSSCERADRAAGGPGALLEESADVDVGGSPAIVESEEPLPATLLDARARVATVGLDDPLLEEAVARAAMLPRLHNMIVARHGQVEVERHFRGPAPHVPANVKSVSKSILSAIVGIAVAEGYLDGPDHPMAAFFPELVAADADPAKARITLGHLLSMRSGLESTSSRNYGRWVSSGDWVRYALSRPLVAEPGQRMIYSTGNSHLVSAALTAATGRSTHAFARERLADPLGIRLPPWLRDPQGIFFGGNDMHISARDLLRFGELYRNGGAMDGRQIVPREWVEESWRVVARSARNRRNGYGLGWWGRSSNGFEVRYAWGYGGQFLFIVPALELTVVFTSDPVSPREGPHNAALHALIDELLVPAAIAGRFHAPANGANGVAES